MIVAGCDVGSLTGKAIIIENGKIAGTSIIPSTIIPGQTANRALDIALKASNGIKIDDIEYIVGTGYGRVKVPFANENISEISCHGFGAWNIKPTIRTIVDIGGQDSKVVKVNEKGKLINFIMNDKCAAGTGRFLEVMAKALELDLDQLGPFSLKSSKPELITTQCSVFAESEVISLVAEGKRVVDIVAGIHESIASRTLSLLNRVGIEEDLTITGGVAKNIGVISALEKKIDKKVIKLDEFLDPQIIGAYGAALFAKRILEKELVPKEKKRTLKKWDF